MPSATRGLAVSDGSDLVGYIGGGGGAVAVLVKFIWDSVQKRNAALEKKVALDEEKSEDARDKKMDAMLAEMRQIVVKVGAMELDMRSLLEKHATQIGAIAEVKARVEGISTNHGARIGTIEQALVELRTRLVGIESPPKRGK